MENLIYGEFGYRTFEPIIFCSVIERLLEFVERSILFDWQVFIVRSIMLITEPNKTIGVRLASITEQFDWIRLVYREV